MHRKNFKLNPGLYRRILSMHLFLLLFATFFFSCENDIEKIKAITSDSNYPVITGYNSKLIFSDSAVIKFVLETKEYNIYQTEEEQYTELPQGFKAYLYNEEQVENYIITADYGIAHEDKKLWIARKNVVVRDLLNDNTLNTEELFWDQENEKIYSEKFTKITDKDGIYIGENGFVANQDFSKYELIGAKGTVNVDEED